MAGEKELTARLPFAEPEPAGVPAGPAGPATTRRRGTRGAKGAGGDAAGRVEAAAVETFARFADVALNRPVRTEFTYGVPAACASALVPGMRVAVPFGPRREVGVVTALRAAGPARGKARAIAAVLDDEPLVDGKLVDLAGWIASYYGTSWGEALAAILPSALKREGGARRVPWIAAADGVGLDQLAAIETSHPRHHRLLRALLDLGAPIEQREICRRANLSPAYAQWLVKRGLARVELHEVSSDPLAGPAPGRERPAHLSADQERAVAEIERSLQDGQYATVLLQGVTGSGKTEVYLRAIERALALGRGAIVIVPEISLTPQTVGWFRSRFGRVAVLHSRMGEARRRDEWLAVRRRDVRVVVGARSAIFAPVPDLGVVVVDEEHEPSFKQESTPRYHARDVAVVRARDAGAVCILGSATPSLESWHNARTGRYRHLRLTTRIGARPMPPVEIVDMRSEPREAGEPALFSRRLLELLRRGQERGEQSILFQNRRGYAPVLWCPACGETVRCAHCDVALTFHRRVDRAVCHSCCEEIAPPKQCPSCTAPKLRFLGAGSEKIEGALGRLVPGVRAARMDSDTMIRREDYEDVLDRFGRGEVDVLVGTQMIAKGLDFPRVTLVGIVSADSQLHQPDPRAAERTFQLLAQVAGRAGRGQLEGRIVVQTSTPAHPAITFAARHDFEGFAASEMRLRQELGYPPFGRLLRVVFEDEEESRAEEGARACAEALRPLATHGAVLLGPAEAPIARLRGRYRRHLLVKAPAGSPALAKLRDRLLAWAEAHPRPRTVVDVDPASLL
ncbi:MAG: primosomal protein N' [Planctomycetes bacterium]|nr:primosomal protein N' [Planctomycetota bacterium]